MSSLAQKFRGPLIAVVVLLLSASLAFAGGGIVFPDLDRSGGVDQTTDNSSGTADDGDPATEEETDDPADEDEWDNHGDLVSDAAQMVTPTGFLNHGAFVSCVAKLSYGKKDSEAPADFVLAELTPEDCEETDDPAAEEETDDPAAEEEDEWDNHGDLVSDAAQMVTPGGFLNHGAFVSCVAKMTFGKKGSEAPADFVLADLTPEACEQAEADAAADEDGDKAKKDKKPKKAKTHGKGHGRR